MALLLFLLTLFIGNFFTPANRAISRSEIGHDFLAFYTAGTFVRTGRASELYDLTAVRDFQHQLAGREGLTIGQSFGPWWNPPFYALAFAPLSALSYQRAADIWRLINLASLAGAMAILCRILVGRGAPGLSAETAYELRLTRHDVPASNWRDWLLVPLLILVSSPFLQAISHGQNTFTSLLLLAATAAAWRLRRGLLAGLVGALLFYKPQLGAVVALALVFDLGWCALVGLAITGGLLLLINVLALPGTLGDYLHRLPANVHFMQIEHAYLWERHVTLKAFWRLLFQGRAAGESITLVKCLTYVSVGMLAMGLGGIMVLTRLRRRRVESFPHATDRLIAATVAAMPLLMPFYFDYDLLLLAIPATLFAREIRTQAHRAISLAGSQKVLIGGWILLFLNMFLNAHVGLLSHVNLAVPLLSLVAVLLIVRAARSRGFEAGTVRPYERLPLARAA